MSAFLCPCFKKNNPVSFCFSHIPKSPLYELGVPKNPGEILHIVMDEICMVFGFFAGHIKTQIGGIQGQGQKIDSLKHWNMLREAIKWNTYKNCPVAVVITGAKKLQDIQERQQVSTIEAEIIEYQKITNHYEGAAVTIREGLKWAREKYKYFIFAQEDILFSKKTIKRWELHLHKGNDWVGRSFGGNGVDTSAFSCRVGAMFDNDNNCVVDNLKRGLFEAGVERRLRDLKAKILIDEQGGDYCHFHNYNKFLRYLKHLETHSQKSI